MFGSTTDYSHSIDEENLKKFIDNPTIKQGYFGNKKSSINRLGEYNLAKGKARNGEFFPNGHYMEKINKVKKSIESKKYSFS